MNIDELARKCAEELYDDGWPDTFTVAAVIKSALTQATEQLQKERDELKETVKRCWSALGIETYSDAKPLTVWEHITELRRDKERLDWVQDHYHRAEWGIEFAGCTDTRAFIDAAIQNERKS